MFGVLGFDPQVMYSKMKYDIEYNNTDNVIKAIETASIKDTDKTEQIAKLQEEAESLKESMKHLDFFHFEKELFSKKLIELNREYSELKSDIFRLESNKKAAEESISKQVNSKFDIDEIEKIFEESKIVLSSGVKRSYKELIEFNHQITESRRKMLSEVTSEIGDQLKDRYIYLEKISTLRTKYANILSKKDYKETYEAFQSRLLEIEKEVGVLSVQVMKKSKEEFIEKKNMLEMKVAESKIALRNEKERTNTQYERIQHYYSYLLKRILKINAAIELVENGNGNIDFNTRIRNADIDMLGLNGEVFKRVSCGVIDLAIAASFPEKEFLVIHDGLIDGIAAPIKKRYLQTANAFSTICKFQYVLTGINENIPEVIFNRCVIRLLRDNPEKELIFGKKY